LGAGEDPIADMQRVETHQDGRGEHQDEEAFADIIGAPKHEGALELRDEREREAQACRPVEELPVVHGQSTGSPALRRVKRWLRVAESADAKNTSRAEAFSDGVFAIAITLLVLELRPPTGDLLGGLLDLWPGYLSFALSFATILIMWVNHHGLFLLLRKVDAHILFTNGFLLLFVTFVPFPTAVLGAHLLTEDSRVAAGFYALTFVAINVAWVFMWQSIRHRRREVAPAVSDHDARTLDMSLAIGFVSYAAAVALAFWNALASVGLCMLLAIFWTVQAFRRHEPESHST
jgi:uncharacterized membrane protein